MVQKGRVLPALAEEPDGPRPALLFQSTQAALLLPLEGVQVEAAAEQQALPFYIVYDIISI